MAFPAERPKAVMAFEVDSLGSQPTEPSNESGGSESIEQSRSRHETSPV